jgi:Na+-transporting NADH:ubiquinone oxidoreductase subunit D
MPPQDALTSSVAFKAQLWDDNPIFRQVLGICSTLAVTNYMFNTMLMCIGLIWATTMSSLTVSLLREFTPKRVRIMVQVLIISVYVIVVSVAMQVWYPDIYRSISAYVGLIITNCIVLGRLEAFANKNPVVASTADGFGAGVGYSFILMAIATVREYLGFRTLFGYAAPTPFADQEWVIMIMPPGAFFVLALAVWVARGYDLKRQAAKESAS